MVVSLSLEHDNNVESVLHHAVQSSFVGYSCFEFR